MENNLSDFFAIIWLYCLTSALLSFLLPPWPASPGPSVLPLLLCSSALALPSCRVQLGPSALAPPPWTAWPAGQRADHRPSNNPPSHLPVAFPSARRICQGALYCTFHCFSHVWLQTVKWIKCTLLYFPWFSLGGASNCKVI